MRVLTNILIGTVILLTFTVIMIIQAIVWLGRMLVFKVLPAVEAGLDWLLAFLFVGLPDMIMKYSGPRALKKLSKDTRKKWPKYYRV